MAAINQIKLNSTSTTYDVNDKRITTSEVSTATHFLATDSSVSSIAPITAANLASVLGRHITNKVATAGMDANYFELGTSYSLTAGVNVSHKPPFESRAVVFTYGIPGIEDYSKWQLAFSSDNEMAARDYEPQGWNDWKVFPSFYKNYNSLAELKAALNAL